MPDPNANRRDWNPGGAAPERERSDERSKSTTAADKTKRDLPTPEALLVDVDGVAAMLSVSRRTVIRLDQAERIPAPTRLGRAVRWSRAELIEWDRNGRPTRRRMAGRKGVRHDG